MCVCTYTSARSDSGARHEALFTLLFFQPRFYARFFRARACISSTLKRVEMRAFLASAESNCQTVVKNCAAGNVRVYVRSKANIIGLDIFMRKF